MTQMRINGVYTPSEKQKDKGIFGTVNLSIVDDSGIVLAQLNGIMVRQTGEGQRFLAAPGYSIGVDPETQKQRYRNHFKLFPLTDDEEGNKTQKERMASLTVEVGKILDAGGTPTKKRTDTSQSTAPAPAPTKAAW